MKSLTFICLLFVVLAADFSANAYTCDEAGYAAYLEQYPQKCGSGCQAGDEYFEYEILN